MFNKDVILVIFTLFALAYGSECKAELVGTLASDSMKLMPVGYRISLKDSATVSGDSIMLYDIASVSSSQNINPKNIPNIFLGYSAPAGYFRYLEPTPKLNKYFSRKHIDATINGSSRIKVYSSCRTYKLSDFRELIINSLSKSLAWTKGDMKITLINGEKIFKCRELPISVRLEDTRNKFAKGNVRTKLFVEQNGKTISLPVICKVKVETEVAVAKCDIKAGEILTSNNIALRRLDITRFGSRCFLSADSLKNLKTTRTVKRGYPIFSSSVKVPNMVEKGDIVKAFVNMGKVKINMMLRARASGNMGKTILVENMSSHKILRAVVSGNGKVEIEKGRIL